MIGTWPTSGGKKYLTFSGWIKTNDTPYTVRITVRFYSSTDCSGGQISEAFVDHSAGFTDWKQLSKTVEIPAGTQGVKIELHSVAMDAHTTYWDDIRAFSIVVSPVGGYVAPVNRLELLAPWLGLAALAGLVLAGAVALARKRVG